MTDREKDMPEDVGEIVEEEAPATDAPSAGEGEDLSRLKSRLMYLAAEFDNYRKRVAREKADLVTYGNERLLAAILPFLDNLERALALAGTKESAKALLEGVRLTYDQVLQELRKFGLEQVSAEGQMFDPRFHEALARVPWEGKPEGTILSESRKGYLLNGRLLRPAQVVVSQAPPETGPDRNDGEDVPVQES